MDSISLFNIVIYFLSQSLFMSPRINLDFIPHHIHETISRLIYVTRFGIQSCNEKTHFNIEDPTSYVLTLPPYRIKHSLQEIKNEYIKWIIKNALCQAIESVNTTFDDVYYICLILKEAKNKVFDIEDNKRYFKLKSRFHKKGFPEKIEILQTEFKNDILPISFEHMLSINKVRNCLVHRNGIVSEKDFNSNDSLAMRWKVMEMFLHSGNKTEKYHGGQFKGEKGKGISMTTKYIDKEKIFLKNQVISFTEVEFNEICLFFSIFGNDIKKSIINYAKEIGYPINIKQN